MKSPNKVDVAVYQQPKHGYRSCGDSYYYIEKENEFVCALADGLGSGEFARESSQVVVDIIRDHIDASVEELLTICTKQLLGKRGAVLGILKIDFKAKTYTYSSIGNIGIMTITEDKKKKRNIPNAGYLTGYSRPFKVMQGKLEESMNFIMFSDGVSDTDLMYPFLLNMDVHDVIHSYEKAVRLPRKDDTTLIAMRYEA
ncbi:MULTISPECIES: SpoIIE family protein phosphatase [unclassified Virgibacillus]|uniref:SpoIIE family protein phosphatase n=1 Tax=unclassified Virgibacillus TaxID=2620237 RepID=UPI0024DE7E12|nr:SpoIIE family protein phosphatase [Virgibacillus sp. LDC-1]